MTAKRVKPNLTTRRQGIGFYFWTTIFILIAFTAIMVVLATLRPTPDNSGEMPPVASQISFTQEQLTQIGVRAHLAGQQAVSAHIDTALNQIFNPVYQQIPAYSDFHYSVWGQYAELLAAGAETLRLEEEVGSIMRQRLFDGFVGRYATQTADLQVRYESAVADLFNREGRKIAAEQGAPLSEAAQLAFDDARQRMTVTAPAGSAAATVAVVAIVKPIAKKVVAATAAKAAAKGIGKASGIGSAALVGAAVGSSVGPVGTAVGSVGAALAAWLTIDYAVVKLDEYFNRDEFVLELTSAIDEQKKRMKQQFLHGYAKLPE